MTIKMKMKAVLVAAMFATAGLSAQVAQAAVLPYTAIATNPADGSLSGGFGAVFLDAAGLFENHFLFSIGSGFQGSSSISSSFTNPNSDLTITGFNLVRYDGAETNVLGTITGINKSAPATVANPHPDDVWSIVSQGLTAGNYYVQVTGKVESAAFVSYGGSLTVLPVAAVPEPETYGMMLGGLALLGVVARRKAAKKAA